MRPAYSKVGQAVKLNTDSFGPQSLAERLGAVDGLEVEEGRPLARHTTLRIGGPAEHWVEMGTESALTALLAIVREAGVAFQLLGQGSNVLVPDRGLRGVVGRLAGDFRRVRIEGELVEAGGAVSLAQLARRTAKEDLVGLEALAGFPSTVGGAVWMNAGCYGTEIKDLLVSVSTVGIDGQPRRYEVGELGAAYRSTVLQRQRVVVTSAHLRLQSGDGSLALRRMDELNRRRWSSLPSGHPSAGSVFKNPPGDFAGRLIEACQLKGVRQGQAAISERHANVIVNCGGARADDVFGLMRLAYESVRDRFSVRLRPEIVLTGELAQAWEAVGQGSSTDS